MTYVNNDSRIRLWNSIFEEIPILLFLLLAGLLQLRVLTTLRFPLLALRLRVPAVTEVPAAFTEVPAAVTEVPAEVPAAVIANDSQDNFADADNVVAVTDVPVAVLEDVAAAAVKDTPIDKLVSDF